MENALNLQLNFDGLPLDIERRVRDARAGKMSDCARAVLEILADADHPHLGRNRAIQISDMQAIWELRGHQAWSDRSVKGAVKQLVEAHEVPVGSSRAGTPGYFLIASEEDLQEAESALRAEVISLARRLKAINPRSAFGRMLAGQLGL